MTIPAVPPVGLILLAAGGSRRMGTPKQLLRDAEGCTLIRRAAQTALASACRTVVVVLGAGAEACKTELTDLPLTITINCDWQTGMASSLKTGLCALLEENRAEAAIVMLCDQPFVNASLLDSLIANWLTTGDELIVCEYGGIGGVPALFGCALFSALAALQGDEGARRIISAYSGPQTRIAFPDGNVDVDTPEDFSALR